MALQSLFSMILHWLETQRSHPHKYYAYKNRSAGVSCSEWLTSGPPKVRNVMEHLHGWIKRQQLSRCLTSSRTKLAIWTASRSPTSILLTAITGTQWLQCAPSMNATIPPVICSGYSNGISQSHNCYTKDKGTLRMGSPSLRRSASSSWLGNKLPVLHGCWI